MADPGGDENKNSGIANGNQRNVLDEMPEEKDHGDDVNRSELEEEWNAREHRTRHYPEVVAEHQRHFDLTAIIGEDIRYLT